MGFFRLVCCLLLPLLAWAQEKDMRYALYLMHSQQVERSIETYQKICEESGRQDFDILQKMALILLEQGSKDEDQETQLMAMFGAGVAASTGSLDILERGLMNKDPQVQLAALHFLVQIQDDHVDDLLSKIMSSEFLLSRMEAAYFMAQRKHPHAVGHIEALMHRLPFFFRPYFPSLFALIGTNEGISMLRKLLDDPFVATRVEAILSIARFGRDDLLPNIRKRATHADIAEQEACAYALGVLKDSSSIPQLKRLVKSSIEHVKLAACRALIELGDTSVIGEIEQMAEQKNVFAILALGDIAGSEQILYNCLKNNDIQVRINAAVALIKRRDPRCLPVLAEILVRDVRDLAFQPQASLGHVHMAWKIISSAQHREKDPLIDLTLSLSMREQILRDSLELPEEDFLEIARYIFQSKQHELIPQLVGLLENLRTVRAIALLKYFAQERGAPLIRDYCNLALFRLKVEGPYEERVKNWLMTKNDAELIRLRPILSWKDRQEISEFQLSAEETSQLLIDTYSAVASRQDEKSIRIVLDALKKGNPKNRFALVGLLIRATE